jgi:hypothetical protein
MKPDGWKCTLEECLPGFFVYDDILCFKGEYSKSFNEAGEFLCVDDGDLVQPVKPIWEED